MGFAGVKGFAGGFGRGALGPWGEPMIKQFVQEAILRENPVAARKLVSTKILSQVSTADWAAGTLPLPLFPKKYFGGAGYDVLRSRERQVLLDVGLTSTAPETVKGFTMLVELRRR